MTDQEILCTFMEPRPKTSTFRTAREDMPRWWRSTAGPLWRPVLLDLNWIHEVEERLTDEHRREYELHFFDPPYPMRTAWALIHATPEQKIKALAAILRPIVEAV